MIFGAKFIPGQVVQFVIVKGNNEFPRVSQVVGVQRGALTLFEEDSVNGLALIVCNANSDLGMYLYMYRWPEGGVTVDVSWLGHMDGRQHTGLFIPS